MSSGSTCKECGTAIPADSPGRFCAQCLFGLGLEQAQSSEPESARALTEKPGDRIGRYKLLQEIGHGGCGVVYMAEQEEPVRRKVALKVIKLGMDTRQVVARFEAERQALALMDHPNIARIFDAGVTEGRARHSVRAEPEAAESGAQGTDAPYLSAGRPYFVMELVGGIKITDYCDEHQLTTRQRLDLFIQICRAIQHAHQKGVIHRDIKPSNVLVTEQDGVPVPKVIDFGIAKATQGKLTDQTLFTAFEQFIGTPAYMSPEQAQLGGMDVDTRSDIYGLGVLLYELLTGTTPFDTKELVAAGLDEMRRTIREVEPVKPSTRLTRERLKTQGRKGEKEKGRSTATKGSPSTLNSQLSTDLDWIVMKCLEKDRARRYETANGLASDVHRHLNNEPVLARPPSKLYEFQKTFRRHKFGFAATAAIILVLMVGAAFSTWQAVRATRAERAQQRLRQEAETAQLNESREREKAQTEAAKSKQVAGFLTEMLQGVGPSVAQGRDTRMLREILDKTAQRVTNDLHQQPEVEAELMSIIGGVYKELGEDQKAERMYQEALTIYRKQFGDEDPRVAESLAQLCYTLWRQGKKAEAEARGQEAVALYRKLRAQAPGIDNSKMAFALNQLAHTLFRDKRPKEAEAAAKEALEFAGPDPNPTRAYALYVLALVILGERAAEAESLLQEAVAILSTRDGDIEHTWVLEVLSQAIAAQGRFDEAEDITWRVVASARQSGNLDSLAHGLRTLGRLLQQQGKFQDAENVFRESLEIMRSTFGDGYRIYGAVLNDLAETLQQDGRPRESANYFREALALRLQRSGRPGLNLPLLVQRLVEVLMEDDNPSAVDELCYELKSASGTKTQAAWVMRARGNILARRGQWEQAAADFNLALELHSVSPTVQLLAAAHLQNGSLEACRAICQRGIDLHRESTNSEAAQRIAITCLVLPRGTEMEALSKITDTAMTHPNALSSPAFLLTKGLAEYRQDHFDGAVDWSERALACPPGTNSMWVNVQAYAVKAMAQCQLQQTNAAQSSLGRAMELANGESSKLPGGDLGAQWLERVYAEALMREAEAFLRANRY